MPGFSSIDDFVSEVTVNGKFRRVDWFKNVGALGAQTAGAWYDAGYMAGSPVNNAFAGTALNFIPCSESTGNGTQIFGMQHGGNVSSDTKHLVNVGAYSGSATSCPAMFMLVDIVGYYPGISLNSGTAQTFVNTSYPGTPIQSRYTDGAGLQMFLVPYSGTVGATAHNLTVAAGISYHDQAGNTKRLGAQVNCTASAILGRMTGTGTGANCYGPFLPLASGVTGIRAALDIQLSASSAGTAPLAALVLCRPICSVPLVTVGVAGERDLLNQVPSLPRIIDGACLSWIYMAGAATPNNSIYSGYCDFAWG